MTARQLLNSLTLLVVFASLLPGVALSQDYNVGDNFSDTLRSGGAGPNMVVIPEGSYVFGGGRPGADNAGVILLSEPFAVSATEVTRAQYRGFLKSTRSAAFRDFAEGDDTLPVAGVSWDEAVAFVTWLSRETGHYYRLPSATEWEYAARADTNTTYSWGDDLGKNNANCIDCKSDLAGSAGPVGSFEPNAWKLHDMHGNVWEWTMDCVDANSAPPPNGLPQLFGNCDSRELRGGSAESDGWSIRSSARAFGPRKMRNRDVGFRIVMDIPET